MRSPRGSGLTRSTSTTLDRRSPSCTGAVWSQDCHARTVSRFGIARVACASAERDRVAAVDLAGTRGRHGVVVHRRDVHGQPGQLGAARNHVARRRAAPCPARAPVGRAASAPIPPSAPAARRRRSHAGRPLGRPAGRSPAPGRAAGSSRTARSQNDRPMLVAGRDPQRGQTGGGAAGPRPVLPRGPSPASRSQACRRCAAGGAAPDPGSTSSRGPAGWRGWTGRWTRSIPAR